jgi:putative hydrolase of the HAD superfamily
VKRAVVFDLFETLVDYDEARSREFSDAAAALLGRDPGEFAQIWRRGRAARDSGPLAHYIASLGLDDERSASLLELRRGWALRLLSSPRPGTIETLVCLRDRGIATGLITVCADDVPAVWSETPFAGRFNAEVFSCSVGLVKPDPRIYMLACDQLGVEPSEALFVGDGANDELAGAERVGMCAVLIHRPGQDPSWPEVRNWPGPRVTALPEVLELV